MEIYERFGRQTEAFEQEKAAHLVTINTLKRIALGEVLPAQLVVTDSTWQIVDPPEPEPDEEPESARYAWPVKEKEGE